LTAEQGACTFRFPSEDRWQVQGEEVQQGSGTREARSSAELVEQAFRAFARRDVAGVVALTHPKIEFFAATGQIADEEGSNWERGAYWGHEGVVKYFEHVGRVWDELEVVPDRFHVVGNRLLVLGRVRHRDREGAVSDLPAQWVWKVRDGRIVYWCVYTDRDEAFEAAGVDPEELGEAVR
jgi:ketosteroid isomerase-like protein